ncbi:Dual specificity protein phosphatase 12 [Phytophthora nicotianae]|uniref:protein-tyrosine-phosphatase n=1 Tax=Phytophthora nicotianae TaxID=4792 RepID=A0A0W8BZB2_PHYNI|nr:Dual specificity protein phosphatase 12 [Phytophthora nicotianae]
MLKEELPVVSLILERQSHHPLLEGFPTAARIGDLPLYLGEAGAAQDAEFLETNKIQAVIALGTGNLTAKPCEMLLIDILDMEEELLLLHFDECISFLKRHLMREDEPAAVLVHCVYGQSRSAAICVAFLMATQSKTLLDSYDEVQKVRPCISINPGFLRQLELFERMENNPQIMSSTPAHAELRMMMAKRQRLKTGVAEIVTTPQLTRPAQSLCCRKCNYVLCTTRNQLTHTPATGGICAGIFIEPMQWMTMNPTFMTNNDGKLLCPSCKAKLGSWNWIGVKCNCKCFVSPAFQLVPSRTHCRVL